MSKARELAELGAVYDSGALSNRNLIINGAMQVAQRGTTFTTAASGTSLLDRFGVLANVNGSSKITYSQSTEAPTGFNSSMKLDVATALSVAAADYHIFKYNGFEQQDIDFLKFGSSDAKQITLSFWVKSNKTGTLAAEFQYNSTEAGGASVELAKTYTINAANTWEHKTLTWPASTSNTSNVSGASRGMLLYMWIAAGTNYTSGSIATDWGVNSNATRVPGQTNYLDSTSNELYFTGFQLEVGTEATPFEHRSYSDELERCKRYYQVSGAIKGYPMVRYEDSGNGKAYSNWRLIPEMRTSPSVSFSGTFVTATGYSGTPTAGDISARQFRLLSASNVNPNDNLWVETNTVTEAQGIISDAEF